MQGTQDSDIGLEGLSRGGATADRECQRGPETIAHEAQSAGTPNSGGRTFSELPCKRRGKGFGWRLQGTLMNRQTDVDSCCAGGWQWCLVSLERPCLSPKKDLACPRERPFLSPAGT